MRKLFWSVVLLALIGNVIAIRQIEDTPFIQPLSIRYTFQGTQMCNWKELSIPYLIVCNNELCLGM